MEFSEYAVNRAYCEKTKSTGFVRGLVLWLAIFLVFFIGFYLNAQHGGFDWYSAGVGALLPTILLVSFVVTMQRMRNACQPQEGGNILRPKTLELTDHGLRWADEYQECLYGWNGVQAVDEHQGNVYVFLDNAVGLIIPASSFADDAERGDFVAQIQHHRGVEQSM